MSTRSIASVVVPSLLLLFAAVAVNVPSARAQSGATITATPGSAPDSYTVAGTGFVSAAKIKVIEVTCRPLPCAAGGGGLTMATVDATGRFSVTLTLSDIVPTDRNYRVIAAIPDERAGLATDPQVQVALHHQGVPKPPATGTGVGDPASLPVVAIIIVALGFAALSASVVGTVAARRS